MSLATHKPLIANAHITLPLNDMPLVLDLVRRLGGEVVSDNEERTVIPPVPEGERVGRMLKGLRLRANMTQKALADAIDAPQSHISEYEANKHPIPSAKVALLAKVLNTVEGHFETR